MPTQIQLRRGTTSEHSSFTGAAGEVTVDTTKKTLVVHDGSTAGGIPVAKAADTVNLTGAQTVAGVKTLSSNPVLDAGTANGVAYLNGSKALTTGSALTFSGNMLSVGSGGGGYVASKYDNQIVAGGDASGYYFAFGNGDGTAVPMYYGANVTSHIWRISNTERARIDSSGNLVVGHTSGLYANANRGNITINGASTALLALGTGGSGRAYIYTDGARLDILNTQNDALTFGTNNAERARITSGGDLLVGKPSNDTTTSGTTVGKFDANVGAIRNVKTATGTYESLQNYHNGTYVGGITYSDTATALATSSDARLKTNIENAPPASEIVKSLVVRSFDWKVNQEHQRFGFIAQEVESIFPETIINGSDEEKTKAIDYARFVPLLVKSIQELKAEVDSLKAQLQGA